MFFALFMLSHCKARAIPGIYRFPNLHHFMWFAAWFILYIFVLLVPRGCVCPVYLLLVDISDCQRVFGIFLDWMSVNVGFSERIT